MDVRPPYDVPVNGGRPLGAPSQTVIKSVPPGQDLWTVLRHWEKKEQDKIKIINDNLGYTMALLH